MTPVWPKPPEDCPTDHSVWSGYYEPDGTPVRIVDIDPRKLYRTYQGWPCVLAWVPEAPEERLAAWQAVLDNPELVSPFAKKAGQ